MKYFNDNDSVHSSVEWCQCKVAYPVVITILKRFLPLHTEMIQFVTSCHTCISAPNHHSTNKFPTAENIYVLRFYITWKIFKLGTQHSLCPTEHNTFSNHYNNNFTMSFCTKIFLMHQAKAYYEITGSEQRNNCVSIGHTWHSIRSISSQFLYCDIQILWNFLDFLIIKCHQL
jgi:hypothetical protein